MKNPAAKTKGAIALRKQWRLNRRMLSVLCALIVPCALDTLAIKAAAKPQSDIPVEKTAASPAQSNTSAANKPASNSKTTSVETLFNGVPMLPDTAVLPIQFSYTSINNSLMSALILIDSKPQQCIFATGLNACTLNPDLVATYKLTPLSSKIDVATFNGIRSVPEAAIKNIRLSSISIAALRVGILDASELYTGQSDPNSPALWLGTPFLAAFQVTIDYEAHTITLDRPETILPKDKTAVVLPLEIREGRLYTRVTIPDVGKFTALIDTGTMGTLIPTAIATKLKIVPTKTLTVKRFDGRAVKASIIILPKIQIGRIEQDRVPALYFEREPEKVKPSQLDLKKSQDSSKESIKSSVNKANLKANLGAENGTVVDTNEIPKQAQTNTGKELTKKEKSDREAADYNGAVLGNDFLKRYKVIFNFSRHQMVLIPLHKPEDDTTPAPANVKKPDKPTSTPKNPRNKKSGQVPLPQNNDN